MAMKKPCSGVICDVTTSTSVTERRDTFPKKSIPFNVSRLTELLTILTVADLWCPDRAGFQG